MQITKELLLPTVLPDGTHPVAIKIEHLGQTKRIVTNVACLKSRWDFSKSRVNSRDPDHRLKNELIDSEFRRIAGMIQDFLDKCLVQGLETMCGVKDISDSKSVKSPELLRFIHLIDKKTASIPNLNTRRRYESLRRYFQSNFGDGPEMRDFDNSFIQEFLSKVREDCADKPSMGFQLSSTFAATVNFSLAKGWIDSQNRFDCNTAKFSAVSDRNLTLEELTAIGKMFRRIRKYDPTFKNLSSQAVSLFVLAIALQGLAPVDLANLKIADLSFKTIQHSSGRNRQTSSEVLIIDTRRQKTKQRVHIVTSLDPLKHFVDRLIYNKECDDFLLPCFQKERHYTPEQRQNRLANYFHKLTDALNAELSSIRKRERLEDTRRVTFYFARHAFCNLADSLEIPHAQIQKLIGHKTSVLERHYLAPLTDSEQFEISRKILSKFL